MLYLTTFRSLTGEDNWMKVWGWGPTLPQGGCSDVGALWNNKNARCIEPRQVSASGSGLALRSYTPFSRSRGVCRVTVQNFFPLPQAWHVFASSPVVVSFRLRCNPTSREDKCSECRDDFTRMHASRFSHNYYVRFYVYDTACDDINKKTNRWPAVRFSV